MKRIIPLFLLCLAACNPDPGPSKPVIVNGGSPEGGKTTRPRNRFISGNNAVTSSVVSLSDINTVLQRDCPPTKGSQSSQASVTPYLDDKGKDTLMYIVNYPDGNGWKIYSSDKRTPPIIAESEVGEFCIDAFDGAMAAWIKYLAGNMAVVRSSTDDELAFSEEQILLHHAFWTGEEVVRIDTSRPGNRVGHWEVTTTYHDIIIDSVRHMTPHWNQHSPYNACCPYKISDSGSRSLAGCVAVAGAEVLYYLHGKFSIPEMMYSQGYCFGTTLVHINQNHVFSNPSDSVWNNMSPALIESSTSLLPEAVMIGYIGHEIGMNYGDDYSWAIPANLRTNIFNYYGYSANSGSYNETPVKENLHDRIPVIITASDQVVPVNGHIHTFVADGFQYVMTEYIYYHHWVYDGLIPIPDPGGPLSNPSEPQSGHESYYTYGYSEPFMKSMKINWGWSSQWGDDHTNDGWFSFTAGWAVTLNGDDFDYNHNISMIYNLAVDD